jgi:hypothetical protein
VGYGDISPKTEWGRFAAMAMISFAIITVPQMTNELIEKMGLMSVYARAFYIPKTRSTQHVLICGDLNSSSIHEFFEELFHEDHDATNLHAVVLHPGLPSHEMQAIMKDPKFMLSVTYLEGIPLNDNDLRRAMASEAKAIFIMTNKFSSNPDEEDAKTILQQFSIQRYFKLNSNTAKKNEKKNGVKVWLKEHLPAPMVSCLCLGNEYEYESHGHNNKQNNVEEINNLFCMQLIRPENKRHLVSSNNSKSDESSSGGAGNKNDLVICLNEIKMGVIAKACIFPVGFFIFIFPLLYLL